MNQGRPSKAELAACVNKRVADLIAPNLKILFCGINPGLYSAYTGYHFARPGNRFWPTLHKAGFTPCQLAPAEEQELLEYGYGITSLVARATASAAELGREEFLEGAQILREKAIQWRPQVVAILGISVYRAGFGKRHAEIGLQQESLGPARLWVLPNPSGLNAHYSSTTLAQVYAELRQAVL